MAKPALREQIAEGITAEKIQGILDKCMAEETQRTVTCAKTSCRHKFTVEVFDARTALEAAKWAVEQGYGKVPNAKPVDEVDFSTRDPFLMSAEERGQLLSKCLPFLEGKAEPPSEQGDARKLAALLVAAAERDLCQGHPAFLIDRMVGTDEREAGEFRFDVLSNEERDAANVTSGLTAAFGRDPAGWPAQLGWRPKTGDWFWQRSVLDEWERHTRTINLKARQLGVTWLACGTNGWTALYEPGSLQLMYRQKEEEAFENVGRVWTLLQSLPQHLWNGAEAELPMRGHDAKSEIKLRKAGRASRILAMTSASASGHGKTARRITLDEFSRIDRAGEIMKAVQPAAGQHGRIHIISTANGRSNPETGEGNQFHYLWEHADESGFHKRFLGWDLHPDRDQDWYDHDPEVRGLKSHERAEQYPANEHEAFMLTNRTFFDREDLNAYRSRIQKPDYRFNFEQQGPAAAAIKRRDDGRVGVIKEPEPGRKYAIGADVATGRGADYSAAYVVDLGSMEFVAEYHARIDADLFARDLHFLGRRYNSALIAVETAGGYGEAVIIPLRDGRAGRPPYPNLYRHVMSSRPTQDVAKVFGFPTNAKTRPLIVNQFEKNVRERLLPYVTDDLLWEMEAFVYHDTGTSPRAQEGSRDDRVLAACIALEMYRLRGEHPDRHRKPPKPRPSLDRPWHDRVTRRRRRFGSRDDTPWAA